AFGERPADALFDAPDERLEPTLGPVPPPPPPSPTLDATLPPTPRIAVEELEAPGGPAAEVSSRIDTVAVVLADDPVMAEQLAPLLDALQSHTTPIHVEGIVDEQWHPIHASPRQSWRELRVGLQLASRSGPVGEDEIERFNAAIAEFAGAVGAVSQREAPAAAAARARDLDRFCADADIEVAVNVIGQFGATFAVARVRSLALEHGMSETGAGDLVAFAADGYPEFSIRRFDDARAKASGAYYTGITFALDLPNAADPASALADMVAVASSLAEKLGGQLVDDNRRPLTEAGLASIRRSLEKIVQDMEAHGIPAGSPLARRLFA
ncbi:MAG TPA: cell division protein ZipA C-terminal FtsZ-binding domain-containing protein, partial [Myxococcota bacterium]|nr:cell division protein ZipA C-terminal FtsZ-binding domain-containing protein [Myxococcota bacterium]